MAARIKTTSKKSPRIKVMGPRGKRVSPDQIAQALGAEKVPGVVVTQIPDTLAAVRQELLRRLSSSGGRPALEGTSRRPKIPLDDEDWKRLRQIAEALRDDEVRPTAGQVASVLLHRALSTLAPELVAETIRDSHRKDASQ